MFALFHFSKVFPFVHPYLFPVQSKEAAPAQGDAVPCSPTSCAQGPENGAAAGLFLQGRRLKSLYRRRQLTQRHHAVTHSGALRPAGW
ncbi:hypothetical protein GMST_06510 [Geomonas silvestris]|uniref:Uncharacterized protein n=1 Tax=Geomonas silvestris TaxID=2740184 RepID=A0A6V8MEA8_9BACT|nr:hypothetical protein [Geomonas silvestris]GFO58326.1 hypothetical protein GMST_06510 [Geomonas silvestris]